MKRPEEEQKVRILPRYQQATICSQNCSLPSESKRRSHVPLSAPLQYLRLRIGAAPLATSVRRFPKTLARPLPSPPAAPRPAGPPSGTETVPSFLRDPGWAAGAACLARRTCLSSSRWRASAAGPARNGECCCGGCADWPPASQEPRHSVSEDLGCWPEDAEEAHPWW